MIADELARFLRDDWAPEKLIDEEGGADQSREAVGNTLDDEADASFSLEAFIPTGDAILSEVVSDLAALERRIRGAVAVAFLDEDDVSQFENLGALLREYRGLPLWVTHLSSGSVKVEITGNADEISDFLGRPKPPSWKRRLLKALAVFLGGPLILLGAMQGTQLAPPSAPEVRQAVEQVCQALPEGTKVTVKTGPVEFEIPCGPDQRVGGQEPVGA